MTMILIIIIIVRVRESVSKCNVFTIENYFIFSVFRETHDGFGWLSIDFIARIKTCLYLKIGDKLSTFLLRQQLSIAITDSMCRPSALQPFPLSFSARSSVSFHLWKISFSVTFNKMLLSIIMIAIGKIVKSLKREHSLGPILNIDGCYKDEVFIHIRRQFISVLKFLCIKG